MAKKLKLTKKQQERVLVFLNDRFTYLDNMRKDFDTEIIEEIKLYNDYDKNMQPYNKTTKLGKFWWEQKATIPYQYTIVQTMVARLIQVFFGKQNYLKIYVEEEPYKKYEKRLQQWMQYELDKMKLKSRARDFLEESLIQRTTWLHLIPITTKGTKMDKVDFNIYGWFDVWFDTRAKKVEDTDFFIRDIVPYYKLKMNEKMYMNLDEVAKTTPPHIEIEKQEEYEAKHSSGDQKVYYDITQNSTVEEVETLTYMGVYDISKDPDKPEYKYVVFTWANRKVLIRAEEVDIETDRKILMFPIRPIRQANTLVGKSVLQVTKDLQYLLNETAALLIHNFKLQIKLLFKYNKDGDVDLDELFAGGGNAIGWRDNPNDVDTFQTPNLVQIGLAFVSWIIQLMQQTTGAVDYVMGTSAGAGITETATGIKAITAQAMFKFQMMAENIYGDLLDFVNYIIILWDEYNPKKVIEKFPELEEFFNLDAKDLEDGRVIDIGLNDLTLRRDVERTTFLNGANLISGLLEKVNGNLPKFLNQVLKKLEVEDIDGILAGAKSPAQMQEAMTKAVTAAAAEAEQKKGGSPKAVPHADKQREAEPEEQANNTTAVSPENV